MKNSLLAAAAAVLFCATAAALAPDGTLNVGKVALSPDHHFVRAMVEANDKRTELIAAERERIEQERKQNGGYQTWTEMAWAMFIGVRPTRASAPTFDEVDAAVKQRLEERRAARAGRTPQTSRTLTPPATIAAWALGGELAERFGLWPAPSDTSPPPAVIVQDDAEAC